jgi:hypothetical protein
MFRPIVIFPFNRTSFAPSCTSIGCQQVRAQRGEEVAAKVHVDSNFRKRYALFRDNGQCGHAEGAGQQSAAERGRAPT